MAQLTSNTRIYGFASADGQLSVGNVTPYATTSNTTGSLVVTGGVGVTGNIFTSGLVTVTSTSTSTSTTTGALRVTGGAGISGNVYTGGFIYSSTGVGYATGSGGVVTQLTSRTTGVTLSKLTGRITLFTTTLAAVTSQTFVLTNTFISATDVVLINHVSGGTLGLYNFAVVPSNGSASITIRNNSASTSASEAPVLQFVVVKAATD